MKHSQLSRMMTLLLAVLMLVSVLPVNALAASEYDESNGGSTYYNIISEKEWQIAPGVKETELVLNNDAGTRRQVLHTAIVDVNNPFVKVIPGTKGMWPEEGNYGTQSTSVQALEAEKLGYGNVVVATNCSLSWYTSDYYKKNPHLIGEPLGYSILDGEMYANSAYVEGKNGGGVKTIIVINYDYHPITGEPRPADMPKTWIRSATDPLTGWEEQAIPVLFDFLVKPDANGVPQNMAGKENHTSDIASRTFVGVRADGTLVVAVSDGEQAPYSAGFTPYEMADYMIKMGCVIAANADGGGSTTFCSQRPGEDLKVNCSLSDGGERPTSNTILVVSTAPADGVFARATITSEYDYYTPGSTVAFSALGTDAVGTKVEVPADVEWAIKEDGMGTIENGVFTSNGTEGDVTAQMYYDGQLVGEHTVTIATPEEIFFEQPIVTIPFGKTVKIPVKASVGGGLYEIGLGAKDITFTTTNEALGAFDGLNFIAVEEADAPADLTSTVTATLNMGTNPTATVQLNLGKGSQVLWDFEGGQSDIDIWNVINNRKNAAHWDYELNLSLADSTNGQVHDGNYSMRLETNGLSSKDSHSEQYAWIRLGVDGEALVLENARSVGFWLYVPEDNIQCWVQGHYMTDSNGDGIYDTENVVSMMESENVYYNIDESGWHYLSMDISAFEKVALKAASQYDKDPSDGMAGEKGEFFLALVFHKAINNKLWQENGSINGNYTYYLDNFTVDYSDAVEDRENPVIGKINLNGEADLIKRDVVTTENNVVSFFAEVADQTTKLDANKNEVPLYNATGLNAATAKVYIDGVEVASELSDGVMSAEDITLADGYHRVKFEICDNAGNKSVVIRVFKVESGAEASTIKVVPADPTLDRIPFGSIYWMNLEATAIETIQSVSAVIDLNNVNHWQLDHMELADGFSAEYTIAEETNTATITITRTGDNAQEGEAVLAKLPVRILYFDTDIKTPGYTAQTYWTKYSFWAQDMKMDVDMGAITYVDGYESDVLNVFSNEEFHVDTEMYTSMANMDKAYFAEHGTTHVHAPAAIEDKAPTCAQPGYTGRTFCQGCNSVVEWGTTVPATGHIYKIVDGKLACDCGLESNMTGLQNIDGKNYYVVGGKLTGGWITVDDVWYYFDKTTFAGADGEQVADNGIKFVFENGRLTDGVWQETSGGRRYWYGPGYYKDTSPELTSSRPYEINGKTYLFNRQGYMQIGLARFYSGTGGGGALTTDSFVYYMCAEDGAATLLNGAYEDYFYLNGARQKRYQLVEYNGDFYFVNDGDKIAKNVKLYLSEKFISGKTFADGREMKVGYYEFGADGKMVIPELKNGVVGDYLYINDVKQVRYRLVEFEGNFYFINDGDKVAKNMSLYLSETYVKGMTFPDGRAIIPGRYDFGADGKMVIPALKHGVVGDYLYINDVKQVRYQLVEFEGDFYFVNDGDKIVRNTRLYLSDKFVSGKTFADGRAVQVGYYNFDSNGKMIVPERMHGVYDGYLYINDVKQTRYKLVEFEGDFYFINDGDKIFRNGKLYLSQTYVKGMTFADGRAIQPGSYTFGADGRMVIPELKHGVVGDYLYINDVKQVRYQLVAFEGDFYFVNDGDKIVRNTRLYLSDKFVSGKTFADGTPVSVGYYQFGADGKMIVK